MLQAAQCRKGKGAIQAAMKFTTASTDTKKGAMIVLEKEHTAQEPGSGRGIVR